MQFSSTSCWCAEPELLVPYRTRSPLCSRSTPFSFHRMHTASILQEPSGTAKRLSAVKLDSYYRLFLDEWDKGFMEAEENPEGYYAECIYGAVPKDLKGTLFRNGPGRFTVGTTKINHPYDGDGLVCSLAFKDGSAFFRSRFVKTPEFIAESAAGEILFRGTFATQRPGGARANFGDVYVKNTSNTNVCCFQGRLWSLFEAGQPYRLDPRTLETLGLELLEGFLRPGLPFNLGSPESNASFAAFARRAQPNAASTALPPELLQAGGDAVTAHPSIDPVTGRMVLTSYRVRPVLPSAPGRPAIETEITFWELGSDLKPVSQRLISISGFAFLHDFALTENYYIIFQNPVEVDNVPYLFGKAPAAACVRWTKNTPTLVHLIPRRTENAVGAVGNEGPLTKSENPKGNPPAPEAQGHAVVDVTSRLRTFEAPGLFIFHHANAFENEDGSKIVIDSIHYDSLPAVGSEALPSQQIDPGAAFSSRLRRLELDLKTNVLRVSTVFDSYMEMPIIDPRRRSHRHHFVYGYHSVFEDPQIGIAKIDVEGREAEIWQPGPFRFALEPQFIPRVQGVDQGEVDLKDDRRVERDDDDSGWLIAQLFDSSTMRSEVVLLDAADLTKGPVAVLALREPLPSGLHSCWTDEYYGPDAQHVHHAKCSSQRSDEDTAKFKGRSESRPSVGRTRW